jgi:hypothetical protein
MNLPRRLALAVVLAAAACSAAALTPTPRKSLPAFESEAELRAWIDKLKEKAKEAPARRAQMAGGMADNMITMPASAAPPPAAQALAKAEPAAAAESVTNVQTAGVDEGGIVKVHGDHLVVLRRGRLFTVSLREGLKTESMADAYGPGIAPQGAWYDEMLVSGDTVIVIGYSYQRGGTEIDLFDIDRAGQLTHRDTYHLRSNDYYSSRNYASRLVGDKLIFYTPLYINLFAPDPFASFPAMRHWNPAEPGAEFKRISPATRIYRTDDPVEPYGLALHTVTVCDLARREMDCQATGVLGPAGRVFYVAKESVYVWTTQYVRGTNSTSSAVFRIPLDGGAPTALKTSGSPIDQMSFLESDDGFLNVLLRARGRGEAMWASEATNGSMALLRVPLDSFGDGHGTAPLSAYRKLPTPRGYSVQNRFVGAHLLYGGGATWGPSNAAAPNALHVVRWDRNDAAQSISIPHGVDRIEALGRHAIVVGTAGKDLHFSSVRLDADGASIPNRFTRPNAAQGETRSHGFFYKPEGDEAGLVGLPVVGGGRTGRSQLTEGSAAVMFLRNDALALTELGELTARAPRSTSDGCKASCVDWYGNARPLFLRNRVFALMGYEIVEGKVTNAGIEELRRVSFAPL